MPKHVLFTFAAFLPMLASATVTEELQIEGKWMAGPAVSAGISSSVGWDAAALLEGQTISVVGGQLQLPGKAACLVGATRSEVWRNDMEHFGSGGGNWSDLGLVPVGRDDYPIGLRDLDCGAGPPYSLIFQTEPAILLLEFDGRVFVPLFRPSS